MGTKAIAILLSLILVGSGVGFGAYYVITHDDDDGDDDDGVFNYVSLGASNTNGYGLRGYISDEDISAVLNGEKSRDDVNAYGYQKMPKGSYPDLIRDHLVNEYGEENVTVDQLAISSMRVEELRVLLDSTYDGDNYTSWRFTGENGWFLSADEGGLEALRSTHREKISNADLITVDIGWNNFGVYISNQLINYLTEGTYMWSADVTTIFDTDAEGDAALDARDIIRGYIETNMGEGEISEVLTDVFAYSIIGYIHNFDIVMEKIYGLNPDADVVVIGIQNLLHGLTIAVGDEQIPIGDLFGNFVDMANYYTSSCSPYHDKYLYVKAGTDGHVTTFLDQVKDYDGDVENLDINIKDCFDYYDGSIHIQPMIDQEAATLLYDEYGFLLARAGYENGEDAVRDGKAGKMNPIMIGDLRKFKTAFALEEKVDSHRYRSP